MKLTSDEVCSECPDFVEWEEAKNNWADDAAIRNGAEAITGVPRVGAFAVVAGDEKFAGGDGEVDFAGGILLGAVGVGMTPLSVVNETVWVFVVVDGHDAVFDDDALTWKSDDALDDVLVADAFWHATSEWVFDALLFVFGDGFFVFVQEDDDLAALWDVFLASEMGPRNGGAIDDNAIVAMESVFHATTDDVVRAIDESIEKYCT